MPIVALDNFRTHPLICTHHVTPVFRVELRRQLGGINQITEHDRELPTFSVRRRSSRTGFNQQRRLFLSSRRLCWLSRGSSEFLSAYRCASPDEPSIIFIDHRMCEK